MNGREPRTFNYIHFKPVSILSHVLNDVVIILNTLKCTTNYTMLSVYTGVELYIFYYFFVFLPAAREKNIMFTNPFSFFLLSFFFMLLCLQQKLNYNVESIFHEQW